MKNLNVFTLNLNGARDKKKRMLLYELMKVKRIDVAFVQETHSDGNNEIDWREEWDGVKGNNRSVYVLSRKNWSGERIKSWRVASRI